MKDYLIRALFDAPVCAFWCFVLHLLHKCCTHHDPPHPEPEPKVITQECGDAGHPILCNCYPTPPNARASMFRQGRMRF